MPAGTQPIFVNRPKIGLSNNIIAANITKDLTTGTSNQIFAANTLNGSYFDHVRAKALGTNIASVARIFYNNGGATTGFANNALMTEISLPATTLSEVAGLVDIAVPIKVALPASSNIYVTLGTAVAAGWTFMGVGGDY